MYTLFSNHTQTLLATALLDWVLRRNADFST